MPYQRFISGSIVVGQTTTNPIQLNEGILVGFTTGSNITATALTFLVSKDGTDTYLPLYDSTGTEVSFTVTTAARSYSTDIKTMLPWRWIKLREGTSASAVTQKVVDTLVTFNVENF